MEPQIIYEDNHLLVLSKPAGWLVQGDATGDRTLLDWGKAYIKHKHLKPGAVFLHPAHRIDRPVSGLVIMARTDKALGRLNRCFQDKKIDKVYLALTLAQPRQASGKLRHFLSKDGAKNVVTAHTTEVAGAKESITNYKYLGKSGDYHLIRVHPETGRPHQIRVQLSTLGCTIAGDLKYGARLALPDASVALHCLSMTFEHPVQKIPLTLYAPPPHTAWWDGLPEQPTNPQQ
jgi:23S rRNA pseudouridine1911/1915/1917 synthase